MQVRAPSSNYYYQAIGSDELSFPVNDLRWRRLDVRPIRSATCPRESVLPIRLRPDFSVLFEVYAGRAEHWPWHKVAWKRSLRAYILRI